MSLVFGVVVLVAGVAMADPSSGQVAPKVSTRPSVGIVVAVDESGSLSPEDLAQEKEAAAGVLQLPYSSLEVDAFGGLVGFNDRARPICPASIGDPLLRLPLLDAGGCVAQLRTGGNTNHADAIRVATAMLNGPATKSADAKIVILMTDGKCDPAGRGCDEDDVARAVAAAKEGGVQIWPVAFGEFEPERLSQYANGGAGSNPKCPKAKKPAMIETSNPAELGLKLLEVVRSSSCGVGIESGRDSLRVPVSPLLNKLVIQITSPGARSADPVIHDASGATRICEGKQEVSDRVLNCTYVNPSPAGDWDVTATGSIIVALEQGTVELRLAQCDRDGRSSGSIPERPEVIADAGRQMEWEKVNKPDLRVTLGGASKPESELPLERTDPVKGIWTSSVAVENAGSSGTLIPRGVSESLPWLEIRVVKCEFAGADEGATEVEPDPSPFPWWWVVLAFLVLLGLILLLRRQRRKKRMLPTSTLHVANTAGARAIPTYMLSAMSWNLIIEWNGPTVNTLPSGGDITITRDRTTGGLRVTVPGEDDITAEFERDFTVRFGGSEVGSMRVEVEDLSAVMRVAEDESGGLFGGGTQKQDSSGLFN